MLHIIDKYNDNDYNKRHFVNIMFCRHAVTPSRLHAFMPFLTTELHGVFTELHGLVFNIRSCKSCRSCRSCKSFISCKSFMSSISCRHAFVPLRLCAIVPSHLRTLVPSYPRTFVPPYLSLFLVSIFPVGNRRTQAG
jgi:hypothetical protein